MSQSKGILASILIGLCVLAILACLGGIVGSWWLQQKAVNAVDRVIPPAETALNGTNNRLGNLSNALGNASSQVQNIDATATNVANNAGDPNDPRISDSSLNNLAANLNNIGDNSGQIFETVTAVNSTVNAINSLPSVNVEIPTLDQQRIQNAAVRLGQLSNVTAGELRDGLNNLRSNVATGVAARVTQITGQINNGINQVQSDVNDLRTRISATTARLDSAKNNLPVQFTLIALFATLLLIWFALSQVLMIFLAKRYIDETLRQTSATETHREREVRPGGMQFQ